MSKKSKVTIVIVICLLVFAGMLYNQLSKFCNSPPPPSLDFQFSYLSDTDGVRYMSEDEIFFFDITDGEVTTGGIKLDNQLVKTAVFTDGNLISVYAFDDVEKSRLLLSGECYYISHDSVDIRLVINESVLDCDELILYHIIQ